VILFWGSCTMERWKVQKVEIMYGQTMGEKSITNEKWGLATSNFDVSKNMYEQGLRRVHMWFQNIKVRSLDPLKCNPDWNFGVCVQMKVLFVHKHKIQLKSWAPLPVQFFL
jgi:hypothetical protein